jgi:hypothetical protein
MLETALKGRLSKLEALVFTRRDNGDNSSSHDEADPVSVERFKERFQRKLKEFMRAATAAETEAEREHVGDQLDRWLAMLQAKISNSTRVEEMREDYRAWIRDGAPQIADISSE